MKVVKMTLAALIVSASTLSIAQNQKVGKPEQAIQQKIKKTAEQRVGARMEILNAKLGLNDAQSNKVKIAMLEREKTRDELITKYGENKKAIQENMQAPGKKCRDIMMSTFTDEQKTKFKDLQKNRKGNKEGKVKKINKVKTEVDELEEVEM